MEKRFSYLNTFFGHDALQLLSLNNWFVVTQRLEAVQHIFFGIGITSKFHHVLEEVISKKGDNLIHEMIK